MNEQQILQQLLQLQKRTIAALEWLTLDAKNRFDDCRNQLEPGSQGGYSPDLTDALAVLDELKGETDAYPE